MSLFDDQFEIIENILPYDGTTSYYGKIFSEEEANNYFQKLMTEVEWKSDEAVIFGKLIETNSCLLNLYQDGSEGMAYHSDGEKDLKDNGAISSVSFGAERKFNFKHKTTKELVSLILEHGSLLMMKDTTQKFWLHRLPTTTRIIKPRISLTFRTIDKAK